MARTGKQKAIHALQCLSPLIVVVLIFVVIVLVAQAKDANYDKKTTIANAQVVEKEKSSGTRRSTPVYSLVIQEEGKQETTEVQVKTFVWFDCEVGDSYEDSPGEEPRCYGPDDLTPEELEDLENMPEVTTIPLDLDKINGKS